MVGQPGPVHPQLGAHPWNRPALLKAPHPQVGLQVREPKLGQPSRPPRLRARPEPRRRQLAAVALCRGVAAAAQLTAVQPVPDGLFVDAQLAGDLRQRPCLLRHPVGQVGRQVGEAKLDGATGEALVGSVAALVSAVGRPWGSAVARLGEQAADDLNGGVELAG